MVEGLQTEITRELLSSVVQEQYEDFISKDLGVRREILSGLKPAVSSSQVLVITGLRRVGKSTLLLQLAEKYLKKDYYFISFEDERLLNFKVKNFDLLHEVFISLFGEKKVFLLDEVQNVPGWERFVRRLHDQGYKFIVTGSNASLLSQELGTRLTGRSVRVELFPFSLREFLDFKGVDLSKINFKRGVGNRNAITTKQRGQLQKWLNEYLAFGGIPDALKYPDLAFHKTLYDDVLYRDIATRYGIENVKELKELALYLMSNTSSLVSFNKLKQLLKLGSVNTVKKYIDYLENSWLFFVVNKYAHSVKEQQIASKKIYSVDTGLARSVGFSFSENKGHLMENLVFLELKRRGYDIYYYKTSQEHEVDFFLPKERTLIQVAQKISTAEAKEREFRALVEAKEEQPSSGVLLVITEGDKGVFEWGGVPVVAVPLYEWLLAQS